MQDAVTRRLLILSSILLVFSSVLPALPAELHVHPELTAQTIAGFGAGFNDQSLAFFSGITSPAERERAYDML